MPTSAGKSLPKAHRAPSALAFDVLQEHSDVFGLRDPRGELRHAETVRGADGRLRVRFTRHNEGVEIWGEDLVLHLDAQGELFAFNGVYSATPSAPVPGAVIGADEALRLVRGHLRKHRQLQQLPQRMRQLLEYDGPVVELRLLPLTATDLAPVWRVDIRPNLRDHWIYTVDARSGDIIERYNATPWDNAAIAPAVDLQGVTQQLNVFAVADSFVLIDGSRSIFAANQPDLLNDPLGALVTLTAGNQDLNRTAQVDLVRSDDNTWSDPVAVSAHTNMGFVFDYFLQTHGRLSIDGVGGSMFSIVHVTDEGEPMDNAFWSGTFIAYGDGRAFDPLPGGLDVAAHEMSHGVIQHTVNLEYRNQSGALNESFADVFAAMVDRDDWLLGEDVIRSTRVFPSGALRDMEDPHNGAVTGGNGWQPAHMSEFRELPLETDNGGVHVNSGIPNRACFLLADSIGRDKTEKIYYHILAARLINQRGNFVDMRNAAIQAATELYGANEIAAVELAFDTVGIVGDVGYEAPQRREPIPGEELLLVVSANTGDRGLYLVQPDLQSDSDIVLLTSTPVYDNTGNSVTVAADGSYVLFVDAANNLRRINIDGTGERVLSDTRDWASISLAPDDSRLAATSTFPDGSIIIFDFEDPQRSRAIPLTHPTTQEGVSTSVVLFADALDWDPAGEFLLYDAFNAIPRMSGDSLSFWDVNLLEPDKGFIVPLFPAQPNGVQLGNPTIARTSGRHVVFDRFDSRVDSNEVWVFDLVSGDAGAIVSTGSAIGFPAFSPDDSELAYQTRDPSGRSVVNRIQLDDTRLLPASEARPFLFGAQIPNWLVVADDPETSVDETPGDTLPTDFDLLGSFPNPFNPATTIRFQLAAAVLTELTVFDVRGALVSRLVQEERAAGQHAVVWTGLDDNGRAVASGVYLARLRVQHHGEWTQNLTQRMTLVR
jgi:bacillolysin